MTDERTDGRTDICECRVAFATENDFQSSIINSMEKLHP